MTLFIFDNTFEGLLTSVFEAYSRRTFPDALLAEGEPLPLEFFPVQAVKTRRVFHHTLPEAAGYPHNKNKMPHLLQLQ